MLILLIPCDLYDSNHQFICNDDFDSLGNWNTKSDIFVDVKIEDIQKQIHFTFNEVNGHIDTNCYAVPREIAQKLHIVGTHH